MISGNCSSLIVPVSIDCSNCTTAHAVLIETCGDDNQEALIDLTVYDAAISVNTGVVNWYMDAAQVQIITDPTNFFTSTTIVYVTVQDGMCTSPVIPISINVLDDLQIFSLPIELCVID